MRAFSSRIALLGVAGVLSAGAAASAEAQQASAPSPSVPTVRVSGATGLRSLVDQTGVTLTVDKTGYVAVFALSPGRIEAPLQLLSPSAPGVSSRLEAGKRHRTQPVRSPALMRLASTGSDQVVVAFSSAVRPNLEAFRDGARWAEDLVLTDTLGSGTNQLVKALAILMYGEAAIPANGAGAPFRVTVQSLAAPSPLNRYSGVPSVSECLTEVMRVSYSNDLAQNYADPNALRPLGFANGSCGEYQVDWIAPTPQSLYGRVPGSGGSAPAPAGPSGGSGTP